MITPAVWNRLAGFLLEKRPGIVDQFAAMVRLDPKIPTADDLAKELVMDHLPELLESLAERLHHEESLAHCRAFEDNARAHGVHRWEQHYQLHELLREYAVLRQILMFQFAQFEREQPFEMEDRLSASRTLHDLIDEAMILSADEFSGRITSTQKTG